MPEPIAANEPAEITAVAPVSAVVVGLQDHPYVDWSAVLGGTVVALGLWALLSSFGASVGLFVAPPWQTVGETAATLTLATAVWFAIVQLFAMASGGYLAGRMRHRVDAGPKGEVAFRDGVNGLLVWAVALFAAGLLAAVAALGGIVAVAGNTNSIQAKPAGVEVVIDRLFRPATADVAQSDSTAVSGPASISIVPRQSREPLNREEIARLLDTPATSDSSASPADRAYLATLVASRTNLSRPDAEARVNETVTQWRAERKAAWEKARKSTALLGFWTVAVLLVSGAAAWWAGTIGGGHRDDFK